MAAFAFDPASDTSGIWPNGWGQQSYYSTTNTSTNAFIAGYSSVRWQVTAPPRPRAVGDVHWFERKQLARIPVRRSRVVALHRKASMVFATPSGRLPSYVRPVVAARTSARFARLGGRRPLRGLR